MTTSRGRFGGWSLYVKDGVPAYDYNLLGLQRTSVVSSKPLAPGKHTIRFEFAYDGGGPAKGGTGTPVVEAIGSEANSRFTGRIPKVTIEVK